ncbi:MAG: CPBP family intramembrane metalloprotease [Candidatus Scalindua sediminis]|nr:CPBP family intramembrane metalloprotease [Candidatus Scalindua sediminis]
MKKYKKLILLFLIIIAFSCIISPIVKIPLDFMLERTNFLTEAVDYKDGVYDFGKVMRRVLMLAALIVFIFFGKSLKIVTLISSAIRLRQGFFRQFLFGFLMAGISLLIYYSLAILFGAWMIHVDFDSVGIIVSKIIKYVLLGCLIGFIEEAFFRGFILQSFMEDMSLPVAVCACSLIYSMLHFFRADVHVATGFQAFVGFTTIIQFFKPLFFQFINNLPSIIGLFLVSVVLSYAFIQTKSLYLSIGLHSGWIFMMKADGLFLVRIREMWGWFFGDSKLVTGILVWFFLLCILVVIKRIYNNTHRFGVNIDGENLKRAC